MQKYIGSHSWTQNLMPQKHVNFGTNCGCEIDPGLFYRDIRSIFKFNLTPVFLSKKDWSQAWILHTCSGGQTIWRLKGHCFVVKGVGTCLKGGTASP